MEANSGSTKRRNEVLMGDKEKPHIHPDDPPPLHRAAYLGNLKKVNELLGTRTEPLTRMLDSVGMTPLHHAILGGASESDKICAILVVTDWTDPACLNTPSPLVDLPDNSGKTALHYAAKAKYFVLVQALLHLGASPSTTDIDLSEFLKPCLWFDDDMCPADGPCILQEHLVSDTERLQYKDRLSVCDAVEDLMPMRLIFLLSRGVNYRIRDDGSYTPLMLACKYDNGVEMVTILLKMSSPADINAQDKNVWTALMVAAHNSRSGSMKLLLENEKADVLTLSKEGCTALNYALTSEARLTTETENRLACIKLLVESSQLSDWENRSRILYGIKDKEGDYPLDAAIKLLSVMLVNYLIAQHPCPASILYDSRLQQIYSALPQALIPLLDGCLFKYQDPQNICWEEVVMMDFGPVTGYTYPTMTEEALRKQEQRWNLLHPVVNPDDNANRVEEMPREETKYLYHILSASEDLKKIILLHPLVHAFIFIKWQKFIPFLLTSLLVQIIWIILYTVLTRQIYVVSNMAPAPRGDMNGTEHPMYNYEFNHTTVHILLGFFYPLTAILAMKEIIQLRDGCKYVCNLTNICQVGILVVSVLVTVPAWQSSTAVPGWLPSVAAVGILTGYALFLREVAKLPLCGIYITIFKKVFGHCLVMVLCFGSLLIGFGECLRILVPGKGQYSYFFSSLAKLIVLMTGELEFDDMFYSEQDTSNAPNVVLGQIVFILFVFITVIVIFNLLIGLAVHDVQSLMNDAKVSRLSSQLQQMHEWETILIFLSRLGIFKRLNWRPFLLGLNVTLNKIDSALPVYPRDFETRRFPKVTYFPEDLQKQLVQISLVWKFNTLDMKLVDSAYFRITRLGQ